APVNYGTGEAPTALAAADFNGDGKRDFALANNVGHTVSILLCNGDGTFAPRTDRATGRGPIAVTASDLNADGHLDVAVSNGTSATVSVMLSNAATFQSQKTFAT